MVRPLRIEYPEAVYHITSRGNARTTIYNNSYDRKCFLRILELVVQRYNWLCHAYCLMDNHYHLVIETPDANLSIGMRQLNGMYTQAYNRQYARTGHLFQGRFKAILVEKESHLLELSRYIVLNPVRAALAAGPEEWEWSSYQATSGFCKTPGFLTTDWLVGQFGEQVGKARHRYREFVWEGMSKEGIWGDLKGQIFLGSDAFIERLKEFCEDSKTVRDIPKKQRFANRPCLKEIFKETENKEKRRVGMYRAAVQHGYTLKEIADYLNLHYSTVSRTIKNMDSNKMCHFKT